MGRVVRAILCMLCCFVCAKGKRIIAFGDSITDNGNGTNKFVQAYFSNVLGRPVTQPYPEEPAYSKGRWSNGPVWAEYLADLVGYELVDLAVGAAVTQKSISQHGVGDFYPNNLLSNKRGALNVTLPTLADQISLHLNGSTVTADDVIIVEIGENDLLNFFRTNLLTILTYTEMATTAEATYPLAMINEVSKLIRDGLEALYAAGGRKFIIWETSAGDVLPMINSINGLLNRVNQILNNLGVIETHMDAMRNYTKGFVDLGDSAFANVADTFSTAHPDAQVVLFPFNDVQRGFIAEYASLGFVDAVHGCSSGIVMADYLGSNFYSLADPYLTAPAALATLSASPLLVSKLGKLNKLGADLTGQNGRQNIPTSTADFVRRLKQIAYGYLDDSNTLGHLLGYIFTSLPIGQGGFNPYTVVPTCISQSHDHLFHDEVHPTTKQHALIAKEVQRVAGHLFT